jgi:hypothetical protein
MGVALALTMAAVALGQGRPHGGGPQGTIDYRTGGGRWAMNADGTNNRIVFDSSMRTSPRDGQTHGALISCSLQNHGGAPSWLNVLDDDPINALGDPNQS